MIPELTESKDIAELRAKIAGLIKNEAAGRSSASSRSSFPLEFWHSMGRTGLLGLSIPKEYGGGGGSHLSVVAVGEEFVRQGFSLGLALSWVVHLGIARFMLLGFGNENQLEKYLVKMAGGKETAAIAYGEPGGIRTWARREGDSYILNGEKNFITNGPLAGVYLVFAVTGQRDDRKRLTVFLVPQGTRGLVLTEPFDVNYLSPSPHCGLKLENCAVPCSCILGEEGRAHEDMNKPWREQEDTYMTGVILGGMDRQLTILAGLIRDSKVSDLSDEQARDLGQLQALFYTLRVIAYEAAGLLDCGKSYPEFPFLLASFRSLGLQFQTLYQDLLQKSGVEESPELAWLTGGIRALLNIAKNIMPAKQKKLGREVFNKIRGR